MDIKDVAGIGKPATKLLEVISAGMGKLYEPRAIRKRADAESYAIKALAEAKGSATVVEAEAQAVAKLKQLEALTGGDPDLLHRARLRVLTREVEGQANVEAIAEEALKQLPVAVSDQPVSDDWRRKFFLEAENICDADLQLLWGKVLAGETASPGSYSVRTLDVLKHLSKVEAEEFRKFCSLVTDSGKAVNIGLEQLKSSEINYESLLTLRDAGLLHESDMLHWQYKDLPGAVPSTIEINNGVFIQLSGANLQYVQIPCYALTRAGRELRNLIPPNPCEPYLKAAGEFLRQRGLVVKRGKMTPSPDQPGMNLITFDEDL